MQLFFFLEHIYSGNKDFIYVIYVIKKKTWEGKFMHLWPEQLLDLSALVLVAYQHKKQLKHS